MTVFGKDKNMISKLTSLMLFLLLAGWSTAMAGDDIICANAVFSGSADNVEVPSGAGCFMDGAQVDNVKVFGRLLATGTVFHGNIQAEPGHERVVLLGPPAGFAPNTIHGDLQIKGGVGPANSVVLDDNIIHGNLQAEENSNPQVIINSIIGGDTQVFKNSGDPFSAVIGGNMIGGNLQCKENSSGLFAGAAGPNQVGGDKEDQCSAGNGF